MRGALMLSGMFVSTVGLGCETFTPPTQTLEVMKDQAMVLDTTATRRGTYLIKRPKTSANDVERWVMVAEPPPDAAMASAVKAAVEANIKAQTATGSVDLAQTITQLTQTQTVMIARDTLFRITEAYANGIIEKSDYLKEYEAVLKLVDTLASAEAKKQEAAKDDAAAKKADSIKKLITDPKLGAPEVNKLIESFK